MAARASQSAKAIVPHLTYLSRQEFEIETDDNEQLQGKGQEKNLVANNRCANTELFNGIGLSLSFAALGAEQIKSTGALRVAPGIRTK